MKNVNSKTKGWSYHTQTWHKTQFDLRPICVLAKLLQNDKSRQAIPNGI